LGVLLLVDAGGLEKWIPAFAGMTVERAVFALNAGFATICRCEVGSLSLMVDAFVQQMLT